MAIGYYSCRVVYPNMHGDEDREKRNGEGVLSLILPQFNQHSAHISSDVMVSNGAVILF